VLLIAPAARPATGGVGIPYPHINSVRCASGCKSHGRVETGGRITIRGSGLSVTKKVIFLGGRPQHVVAKLKR